MQPTQMSWEVIFKKWIDLIWPVPGRVITDSWQLWASWLVCWSPMWLYINTTGRIQLTALSMFMFNEYAIYGIFLPKWQCYLFKYEYVTQTSLVKSLDVCDVCCILICFSFTFHYIQKPKRLHLNNLVGLSWAVLYRQLRDNTMSTWGRC